MLQPNSLTAQDLGVAILVATSIFFLKSRGKKSEYPFPPSPKGRLPLLGHALQIPTHRDYWTAYKKWGKELGSDIIYLDAAGTHIVVLNSYEMAKDLLDGRSSIYSGRPSFTMVNELYDWTMPVLQYDARWRAQRRLTSRFLSGSNPAAWRPHIKEYTHKMLLKLLDDPSNFMDHIRRLVGATVTSIAYGMRIQPKDDPNIKIAQDSLDSVLEAFIPGRYLVDTFPLLKYLPEWLPGTGFLQEAKEGRKIMHKILEVPFADAEREIANGTARLSLVSAVLDEVREMDDPEEKEATIRLCKEVACTLFGAGYDTTRATIANLILCMTLFPDVQAKARQELDRVIGPDRLPGFSDEQNLPYLRAVLKELLRWRPAFAIGVPHLSTEDDIYQGCFIPKSTIVITNLRGMHFDPEMYPDPEKFKLERYLSADGQTHSPDVRDPASVSFGFGRRVCPGSHIALAQLFLTAASTLLLFEVTRAKDDHGNDILPSLEVSDGITSHPTPFKCIIKPRSKKAEDLTRTSVAQYES